MNADSIDVESDEFEVEIEYCQQWLSHATQRNWVQQMIDDSSSLQTNDEQKYAIFQGKQQKP